MRRSRLTTERRPRMPSARRGEVWQVDLGMAAKARPAVIFSVPFATTSAPSFARRCAVKPVAQGQNRMPPEHARAGIAHHRPDLFAPGWLIAVNRALVTNGFLGSKPAALQSDGGIIQQPLAFRAECRPRAMMVSAITLHHRRDRLPLPSQTLAGEARAGGPAFLRGGLQPSAFHAFNSVHRRCQVRPKPSDAP